MWTLGCSELKSRIRHYMSECATVEAQRTTIQVETSTSIAPVVPPAITKPKKTIWRIGIYISCLSTAQRSSQTLRTVVHETVLLSNCEGRRGQELAVIQGPHFEMSGEEMEPLSPRSPRQAHKRGNTMVETRIVYLPTKVEVDASYILGHDY